MLKRMGICVGVLDVSTQDLPVAAHARNEIAKTVGGSFYDLIHGWLSGAAE